jgi:uncharacterized protein (TIGR03790 family)
MLRCLYLIALVAILALAACGRNGSTLSEGPKMQLPALGTLHGNGMARSTSATSFELMGTKPVAASASGVDTSAGQLSLTPPADGMSWTVYALEGFPTDGSVVPVSVAIDRTLPCWIAFGDFANNQWEIVKTAESGTFTPLATNLLSPTGTFYVAVVAYPDSDNLGGSTSVDSLIVQVSSDVELPTPALRILTATGTAAAGILTYYDALGTLAGGGGGVDTITWDWNDGSGTMVMGDPSDELSHVWLTTGAHTVTLTVKNDLGASATRDFAINVQKAVDEMLVVYNSNMPESLDLTDYYVSSRTGRSIAIDHILGLPLADSLNFTPNINRTPAAGVVDYDEDIRDPIKAYLDDPDNAAIKTSVKYILLMKGVPHQINGPGEFSDTAELSSVDSELCCLYSDTGGADPGYPYGSWLVNNPRGLTIQPTARAFYLAGNQPFVRGNFDVCFDPTYEQGDSGDEVVFPLDYLVGRIDAYTYDEAKAIIDRAIQADTSGTGWVVFDSSDQNFAGAPQKNFDTMADPVWPFAKDTDALCGQELLATAGFDVFLDTTSERIVSTSVLIPSAVLSSGVIGYAGWGVNHAGGSWAHGSDYILQDLGWTYLPGACFSSYESFNGRNFNGVNLADRNGQGQICDFLRMGGTCAVGNAWEPFTLGCDDERWTFDRYINHGDRWIEAAYKGLRLISWMEVVVGDPLCMVK